VFGARSRVVHSGHAAAAPPNSVMNWRRLIGLSLQSGLREPTLSHSRRACCALQQISAAHVG
jgi:hypothetical protein